jgi:hypothetical protein
VNRAFWKTNCRLLTTAEETHRCETTEHQREGARFRNNRK